MACFPKIDQPCPLGIDEQRRLDGWCARCEKTVHALDGMSEEERRSLLRRAGGPICVAWRRPAPKRIGIGLGAALAASVTASALAIEVLPAGPAAEPLQTPATSAPSLLGAKSAGPECDEEAKAAAEPSLQMVMVGGVSDPAAAEWVDDSDLPDLPMVSAAASPDR